MRIAVVADTHLPRGSRAIPDACLELMRSADLVLHAGDLSAGRRSWRTSVPSGRRSPPCTGTSTQRSCARLLPERQVVDAAGVRIGLVHDAGPGARAPPAHANGVPGLRRGRLRSLPHPLARGGGGLPDLQPGQPDRPPPPAAPQHGDRACGARPGQLSSTSGSTSDNTPVDLDVLFVGTAGSVPTARRGRPACWCGAAATGCCSTAARGRSASCCARRPRRTSRRSS